LKSLYYRVSLLFCLVAASVFGFEATMTLTPPLIELSESAVLSVEVRGAKREQPPALPTIPGLTLVSAGQSQHSSWVNGKTDRYTTYNYRVLPQQTGTFTIGPFEYTLDKQTKTIPAVQLKVVGTAGDAQRPQSWSEMVFARLESDRRSAYVQEPFSLTLSIYSRQGVQIGRTINLQGMPETGLHDLQWQEISAGREVIDNAIYEVRRFRTCTRAMRSGLFTFSPEVTVQVAVPGQRGSQRSPFGDSLFDSFFSRTETRPLRLPVEAVSLDVRPLPDAGRPAGFSGAVGDFSFEVTAQPLEVHPGDPVTLQLRITGDGNLDRITMPPLPLNETFRLYGEPVRRQTENTVLFEQVVSPRTAEVAEIPTVPFSFFDTRSGQYRTVYGEPIPLHVTEASGTTAQVFAPGESRVLPAADRPFATESELQQIRTGLKALCRKIRPFLWTVPAALAGGLMVYFGRRLYLRYRKDTARTRRRAAPKLARKALRAAGRARKRADTRAFYDALWQALTGYFGNRLNLPPGEVTPLSLEPLLPPASFQAVCALLDQIEAGRYGMHAEQTPEKMAALQKSLKQLVRTF